MKNKKITIKDVAKQSGVSIATVSQILNGNEQKFSPKTVEKVLAAKAELNYEQDYFARRMMLCNADLDTKKETDYLEELSRRGVDGFIIASSAISNQAINETLRKKNLPYIVLDQKKAEGFSYAVLTDYFSGGKIAGEHLQQLGHKKVAVVLPEDATENIKTRLTGFKEIYPDAVKVYGELSKIGGRQAAKAIVETEVTGIFAINDEIAFGLYLGLAELKKKIPQDYSVIGYDNIDMSEYVTPQLTTIAQPIYELGQTTAELLLERIEQPSKDWEEKTLPVQLIQRFSTAHLK